jgi:hypothetical protein
MNRIARWILSTLAFAGVMVGLLWLHMRRSQACPVHPCDCHVEYSHCVKECPSEGKTRIYSTCCRLHCLAALEQETKH